MYFKKDDRTPSVTNDGKVKSEYYSDNSASLPGIMGTPGPVGFEPGMFKKEGEEYKQKSDSVNKVNHITIFLCQYSYFVHIYILYAFIIDIIFYIIYFAE